MATAPVTAADRRHRRRQEAIEEILGIMAKIMAEEGVAGLSVGEIARRMGIRPPSVFVYFPSKHALTTRCSPAAPARSCRPCRRWRRQPPSCQRAAAGLR